MSALVSEAVSQLRPYEGGKPIDELERELGITGAIKLASNENAWGPSPRALAAATESLADIHRYPDGAAYHLRQALASRLGVAPAQLVFGNGSNEVLELVVRAFVQPGQSVLTSAGSFIAYKLLTLAANRRLVEVPLTAQMGYDLPALAAAADATTRVVFIANPNNPTGTHIGAAALAACLAEIDRRCAADPPIVVLDEAYLEYVDAPDHPDAIALIAARPRTIVTRTFSKAFGLAGLRCGYGVTSDVLADYLNRVREPFNLNSLAQAAARAALADDAHLARVVEGTRAGRQALTAALTERGWTVTPSQTNFLLVRFGADAMARHNALLRRGVITRPLRPYGMHDHLRITIGTDAENRRLIAALDPT